MKISFTKFLLILVGLSFSTTVAKAENIKVTVDGTEISNGTIVTSTEVNKFYFAAGRLIIEPRVIVEVYEPCHLAVTVKNTTPGKPETEQFCWLSNCNDIKPGESLTKEQDFIRPDSQNLYIDALIGEFDINKSYMACSNVSIVTDRDKNTLFSFDLNMVYQPEAFAEIKDIADSETSAVYYDLTGNQIKNPTTGIYIVRQGEKTFKIKL